MQREKIPAFSLEQPPNGIWPNDTCTLDLSGLALTCALSVDELKELMDYGVFLPMGLGKGTTEFSMKNVEPLRNANRLRLDYDLDLFVVVLLVEQFRRIEVLETEVRVLQARRPSQ